MPSRDQHPPPARFDLLHATKGRSGEGTAARCTRAHAQRYRSPHTGNAQTQLHASRHPSSCDAAAAAMHQQLQESHSRGARSMQHARSITAESQRTGTPNSCGCHVMHQQLRCSSCDAPAAAMHQQLRCTSSCKRVIHAARARCNVRDQSLPSHRELAHPTAVAAM